MPPPHTHTLNILTLPQPRLWSLLLSIPSTVNYAQTTHTQFQADLLSLSQRTNPSWPLKRKPPSGAWVLTQSSLFQVQQFTDLHTKPSELALLRSRSPRAVLPGLRNHTNCRFSIWSFSSLSINYPVSLWRRWQNACCPSFPGFDFVGWEGKRRPTPPCTANLLFSDS